MSHMTPERIHDLAEELGELADMYRSRHPEVLEMMGRKVGEMEPAHKSDMLIMAIITIVGLADEIR